MADLMPLETADFSGGMTDNFIGRETTLFQRGKNFLIGIDRRPFTRYGSLAEGNTNTLAKLGVPVHHLMPSITAGEKPYKLATSTYGRLYSFVATTHVELTGPTGNHLFTTAHALASDARFISTEWNSHGYITSASQTQKPQKVFVDNGGTLQLRTAGLPIFAGTITVNGAGVGALTYAVALVFKYTYTSNARTFIDRGRSYRQTISAAANPPASITVNSGAIVNGAGGDNYDTASASLVVEYYRTVAGGTTFYLVGSIQNSAIPGNIVDGVADGTLASQQPAYFNGGVAEFDTPPLAKFVHVSERGIGYYGNVISGPDTAPNRILQSIPGSPDKTPAQFFDEIDDEVTGISSYRGLPLFFARGNAYRGDGIYDRFGDGGLVAKKIADNVGCVSHNSIVQTYEGVFWAADNGFYWTDGYTVMRVSEEIMDSFNAVYSSSSLKTAIYGSYDQLNKLIYWSFQEASGSDGAFILHLRYGVKPNSVFTTAGGQPEATPVESYLVPPTVPGTITQNFRVKCLTYANNRIYRGDDRGYAFYFDSTAKTDPRVDINADISTWDSTYITYDFRTVAMNFGTNLVRKWTPSMIMTIKNKGNASILVRSDREVNQAPGNCKEIKIKASFDWGDPGAVWGDQILWSAEPSTYTVKRMLPVPGLRCTYRQLWVTNAFTILAKSDDFCQATLDAAMKTLLLVTPATNVWPSDLRDQYVSFAYDGYQKKFLITGRTNTTLTISDASNQCPPSGNYKWQLHGYAKGDGLFLQDLVVPFVLLSGSQIAYRPTDTKGNA